MTWDRGAIGTLPIKENKAFGASRTIINVAFGDRGAKSCSEKRGEQVPVSL